MESAQPEIWTLFPENATAPVAFGALARTLEKPREAPRGGHPLHGGQPPRGNLVSDRTDIRSRSPR
jgi:hypothetical protein